MGLVKAQSKQRAPRRQLARADCAAAGACCARSGHGGWLRCYDQRARAGAAVARAMSGDSFARVPLRLSRRCSLPAPPACLDIT